MYETPWKTKGVMLTAPLIRDVDTVCEFIDRYLAGKVDLIALQIRYRYRFTSHPECMGQEPLSYEDVKKIVGVCKKAGIRLIPKVNLLGHQSGIHNIPSDGILHGGAGKVRTDYDGLLRAYPQFDETPDDEEVLYCRTLCPSHPDLPAVVFDLIDELMDVFEADGIHIGCDEAFNIGLCPRCREKDHAVLFADWVNTVGEHVRSRGAEMMVWGDRLLDRDTTGYGEYEAAKNGTAPAIDLVDKRTVLCDWHYEDWKSFPSVDQFGEKGFPVLISPGWKVDNVKKFLDYAREHDHRNIRGILATTWCNSGELARYMMYGEKNRWPRVPAIAEMLRMLFE